MMIIRMQQMISLSGSIAQQYPDMCHDCIVSNLQQPSVILQLT